MGKRILIAAIGFVVLSGAAFAGDILTGIEGLACEAKLCLHGEATGTTPAECGPSLSYYYNIRGKDWSETQALRRAFLARCPMVSSAEPCSPPAPPAPKKIVLAGAGMKTQQCRYYRGCDGRLYIRD